MKAQFNNAKRKLEEILTREWKLKGSSLEDYKIYLKKKYPKDPDAEICEMLTLCNPYFLRKNISELITRGTNQIILRLNKNYLGKTRLLNGGETSSHYFLHSYTYESNVIDNPRILNKLGFEIPKHNYVEIEHKNGNFKVKNEGFGFVITKDLTENGKYKIEDVQEKHFENLSNGAELKKQLNDSLKILQEIYDKKNPLYLINVNRHATEEGPQEAFKHMFFTQINPTTNTGKLVLGDLDHVVFVKCPRDDNKK